MIDEQNPLQEEIEEIDEGEYDKKTLKRQRRDNNFGAPESTKQITNFEDQQNPSDVTSVQDLVEDFKIFQVEDSSTLNKKISEKKQKSPKKTKSKNSHSRERKAQKQKGKKQNQRDVLEEIKVETEPELLKGSLSDLFDELPKLKYSLDHDLLEFYDEFLEPTETRYSNGYDMEFYKSCDKGLASKPLDAKHPQFGKTDYFVKSLVW